MGQISLADPLTLLLGARATWWDYEKLDTPIRHSIDREITLYANIVYDFNKNLRLQLNVNNIFDKVYYKKVDATGISNYYGDPRNVMLTLSAWM